MLKFTMEFMMEMQSQGDRSHPSDLQNQRGKIPSVGEDADQKILEGKLLEGKLI